MKTIKLQGKDYVMVQERIKYFRENCKDGRIETSYEINGDRMLFHAKVYIGDKLVSTGTGMKNVVKEFETEKCETRAIGRALAIAGIGIDAGIASYDEMMDFYSSKDAEKPKTERATDKQLDLIRTYMTTQSTLITEFIGKEFGCTMLPELTKDQASRTITMLKGE